MTSSSSPHLYDVIIVGAGISGLMAAYELKKCNVTNVLVLEAHPTVGGKLQTVEVEGAHVDLGGQWLGPSQQRLHRLLNELNLSTYEQKEEGNAVFFGKNHVPKQYSGYLPPLGILELLDIVRVWWDIEKKIKEVPLGEPWKCSKAKEYDSITMQTYLDSKCWTEAGKSAIATLFLAVYCTEVSDFSLLSFLANVKSTNGIEEMMEGAQEQKIVGGAQQLCTKLVSKIEPEGKVLCNHIVRDIEQLSDRCIVTTASKEKQLLGESSSTERQQFKYNTFEAKYIIVTVPSPLIPRIMFTPPLPAEKDQLYQRLPIGNVIKTIVLFKTGWYNAKKFSGEIFTCSKDNSLPIGLTADYTSKPGIVGFIWASKALYWRQKTREERLEAILKQYATAFQVSIEFVRSELLEYVEKDWAEDEFCRGGYSCFASVGTISSGYYEWICKPFGRVHFAGTDTALEWNGYIEGAIGSAFRVVEEVQKRLQYDE